MKHDIYDEGVICIVLRDQTPYAVPFCEIKSGDVVCDQDGNPWFTADGDAHISGDCDYEGWVVNDHSQGYFPEDFGAELIRSKDAPDESIQIMVARACTICSVQFDELKEGDVVYLNGKPWFTAATDAFYIDDDPDHYGEYGVQDEDGNTYYPCSFEVK